MEQEKKIFNDDTINLDEIRNMLADSEEKPTENVLEMEPETEEQPEEQTEKSFGEEFYGLVHDLVYIIAAVTIIFVFFVRLVGVDGDSMLPTLHNADMLILESNILCRPDDLKTGDIVVLNVPYYAEKGLIVKRVIATGGQTVDIDFERGVVFVDGVMLEEPYTNSPTFFNWPASNALEYPVVVPDGCIFVLGDNRNDSTDSRYAPVGMIDDRCVLGKVKAVLLPGQTKDSRGTVVDPRDWSRIGLVS